MRKRTRIIGIVLFCLAVAPSIRAQQKQLRATVQQTPAKEKNLLSKKLRQWQLFALDGSQLQAKPDMEELVLDWGQRSLRFAGRHQKIWKPGGKIIEKGAGYTRIHNFPELVHFNGANVRMTIGKNFILGEYTDQGKKYIVEQLSNFAPGSPAGSLVVYEASAVIDDHIGECAGAQWAPGSTEAAAAPASAVVKAGSLGTCRTVDVSVMVNSTSFAEHQSSITETASYIASIYNLTEGDYATAFSQEFKFFITELVISTSPATDPWVHTDDIYKNLENFWYFASTGFAGSHDLSSYWFKTNGFSGGVIGLAYMGFTCNSVGDAAIREFGGSAQTMRCLLSHETGHNFNLSHDAAGAPYIMAPAINGSKTFSAASKTSFENFVASSSASCITDCQALACEDILVTGISATLNTNTNSIDVQWTKGTDLQGYSLRWWEKGSTTVNTRTLDATSSSSSIALGCSNSYIYRVELAAICATGQPGTYTGIEFANSQVPQIILQGPDILCGTSTTEIRSTLSSGNQWYRDGQLLAGATGQTLTVSQSGVYTVRASGAAGCNYESNELFIVQNLGVERPKIKASGNTRFCDGGSVEIAAPEAKKYQWFLNGTALSGETNRTILAKKTGQYSVQTNTAEGCVLMSDSVQVEAQAIPVLPAISLSGDTTLCPGEELTFSVNSTLSLQWLRDGQLIAGATTTSFKTSQAGAYALRITDNLGCSNQSSSITLLAVAAPPKPQITAPAVRSICAGDGIIMTTDATPLAIQWMKDGQPMASANQSQFRAERAGAYFVRLMNSSGCFTDSDPVNVTVNAIPVVPTVSANGATSFCEGGKVVLQTSATVSGMQWLRNGLALAGATASQVEISQEGNYNLLVTDANGCKAQSPTTVVSVLPTPVKPVINSAGNTVFCAGGNVVLQSNTSAGNQWYRDGNPISNANGQNFQVSEGGNYTLRITNNAGCQSEISLPVAITVHPNPAKPPVNWNGTELSTLAGFKTYKWLKDGIEIAGANTAVYRPASAGNFQTSVTDNNNCPALSEVYPLVITGLQDVRVAGASISAYPNPARGTIFLRVVTANQLVQLTGSVIDLQGRHLQQRKLVPGNNAFDLSNLPAGMYVMMVSDGKEKQMIKFVLAR